jgi:putative methionine-R-sulfoxide reductase with GAF domain
MTPGNNETLVTLLCDILEQFDCTSGTLHRAEEGGLTLVAHEGIPESVLDKIETVPIGKGMAGIAAERREPVQVCNLQTDNSGVAEAGARETMMEGSIAAPIIGSDGTLKGVIGIAKPEPYEFTPAERNQLKRAGKRITHRL